MSITSKHISDYQRDGAVLIKNALSVGALKLLEAGIEAAYRAPEKRATKVGGLEGAGLTVVRDYVSLDSPLLQEFIESGLPGEIAARLMKTVSAQLVLDQIFYKNKGPILPTPWHQDTPFLRVRGEELVRLWLPCDISPRELTVQVVRGSHRWNVVYNASGAMPEGNGAASLNSPAQGVVGDPSSPTAPDVRRYRDSFDIMSWDVEPGDVLAFQGNMLHGTDGHPGHGSPRRAFALLLGGPELRYHAPPGKAFPSPGRIRGTQAGDDIPAGAAIGNFKEAFPVCWPLPGSSADEAMGQPPQAE